MKTWKQLLDDASADAALEADVQALIAEAREIAAQPIVRRVYRYEDIGKYRSVLDRRAVPFEPEIQETFALSMSDLFSNRTVAEEMPLLAAAYLLSGEEAFRTRMLEQLEEVATWSPLQRPGWSCFQKGLRLPPDGKDGNWLATGLGVRAIGDVLEILPGEAIPDALQRQLEELLEKEIADIVEDWEVERPWFVKEDNPVTNQWVLPTEGLIRACLLLGADRFPDAYELGVKNLLRALSAHGAAGEFEEGISYASFTVTSMLHAARAMALHGDRRALDHPFLRHFAEWTVQHLQPGRFVVNCFDGQGVSPAPRDDVFFRSLLSLQTVCTGSPVASWALYDQFDGPTNDLVGLAARTLPPAGDEAKPATYAIYERAPRVNWRSAWSDGASGVWVRGGHELDQHDHADRGHVNLIIDGKPILIEAGTPVYHNPDMDRLYSSGVGHNVLQLGTAMPEPTPGKWLPPVPGWQRFNSLPSRYQGSVAPLSVRALNAAGGSVRVDVSRCYDDLDRWERAVAWGAETMVVEDDVRLPEGEREIVLFRWHLGAEGGVDIREEGGLFIAVWPDAEIRIEASAPIEVTQIQLPDCTLIKTPADDEPDHLHTCLVVRTVEEVDEIHLKTQIASSSG